MKLKDLWTLLNASFSEVRSYQNLTLIAPKGQRITAKMFQSFGEATLDSGHSTYQMRVEDWAVEERSAVLLVFEQYEGDQK